MIVTNIERDFMKKLFYLLGILSVIACGQSDKDRQKEERNKVVYKELLEQPYYYKIGSSARHYHAVKDCPFLTECKGVLDTISFERAEGDSGFHCCERCADDMFKDIE